MNLPGYGGVNGTEDVGRGHPAAAREVRLAGRGGSRAPARQARAAGRAGRRATGLARPGTSLTRWSCSTALRAADLGAGIGVCGGRARRVARGPVRVSGLRGDGARPADAGPRVDPAWRTAMIVGHNPGLAELTVGLASPDAKAPHAFPTAAVAVFGLQGPWAETASGKAVCSRSPCLRTCARKGHRASGNVTFPVAHGEFELGTDGPSVILARRRRIGHGLARRLVYRRACPAQGARIVSLYVTQVTGMALASFRCLPCSRRSTKFTTRSPGNWRTGPRRGPRARHLGHVSDRARRPVPRDHPCRGGDPGGRDRGQAPATQGRRTRMGSLAVRLVRAGKWPVTVVPSRSTERSRVRSGAWRLSACPRGRR